MDIEGYTERLIAEALARGDLQPTEGIGEPLPRLDRDADWWVRDLLDRESLPDRFTEVAARTAELAAAAIDEPSLDEARETLRRANELTASWNEDAPAEYRLPERSEIWLLDRRAGRPIE